MRAPSERVVNGWLDSIKEHGVARIKLRTLLRQFGVKRRGTRVTEFVLKSLGQHGLFARGFESIDSLDHQVRLYDHDIRQIGQLADSERSLQKEYGKRIVRKLGLTFVAKEHSPKRTRDRFDFLCRDRQGRAIVVELKRDEGDKRGVEQLMRYIGLLKAEGEKAPRGVLVTGCSDPHTRRALEGREADEHIDWYIYGLTKAGVRLERVEV